MSTAQITTTSRIRAADGVVFKPRLALAVSIRVDNRRVQTLARPDKRGRYGLQARSAQVRPRQPQGDRSRDVLADDRHCGSHFALDIPPLRGGQQEGKPALYRLNGNNKFGVTRTASLCRFTDVQVVPPLAILTRERGFASARPLFLCRTATQTCPI